MKNFLLAAGSLPLAFTAPLQAQDQSVRPGSDLVDLYEWMQREGADEGHLRQILDQKLQESAPDSARGPARPDRRAGPGVNQSRPDAERQRRGRPQPEAGTENAPKPPESGPARRPDAAPPWLIGLAVEPVDPLIRMHLGIPGDTGVRVVMVAPEGPAAKAGIQMNDIVLSANGRPLSSLPELKEVVVQAGREGKPLALELIHEGKRKTVSIQARAPEAKPDPKVGSREVSPAPERRMAEMGRQLTRQQEEIGKLRKQLDEMRRQMERMQNREPR